MARLTARRAATLVAAAAFWSVAGPGAPAPQPPAAKPATGACVSPHAPPKNVIAHPKWLGRPSGAQLIRYYPRKPAVLRAGGCALVSCQVTAAGSMIDCRVLAESPPGSGFALTGLRLARFFKIAHRDLDGASVKGRALRLPFTFNPAKER